MTIVSPFRLSGSPDPPRSLSSQIYSRLLVLYPEDLQREYGAEMALVFSEDLAAARSAEGFRGAARVWFRALAECVRYALPGYAARPELRAPVIGLAFSVGALVAAVGMCALPIPFRGALVPLLPNFNVPAAACLCVLVCRGSSITTLNLSGKSDHRR